METRERNIMINKAGGKASAGTLSYRVALPTPWMQEMGINEDNRKVNIKFDGKKIIIEKERIGMLKLSLLEEGVEEVLVEGSVKEIVEYLVNNYTMFDFIWSAVTEEKEISGVIPYGDLEGGEKELFIEKMPQLDEIENITDLEYELKKVDLSWWKLEIEKI